MTNPFLLRAKSVTADPESDIARISRLPYVSAAYIYEKNGAQITYYAELSNGNTLAQTRELTGYIQNLFGARLLSSGQTQVLHDDRSTVNVVTIRVALLTQRANLP